MIPVQVQRAVRRLPQIDTVVEQEIALAGPARRDPAQLLDDARRLAGMDRLDEHVDVADGTESRLGVDGVGQHRPLQQHRADTGSRERLEGGARGVQQPEVRGPRVTAGLDEQRAHGRFHGRVAQIVSDEGQPPLRDRIGSRIGAGPFPPAPRCQRDIRRIERRAHQRVASLVRQSEDGKHDAAVP